MPKFRVASTVPCFVTWTCEIEAESETDARQKFRNGEYEFTDQPEIGDAVDSGNSEEITVDPA